MQRWIPILAIVLCLQLLVAGALALRRDIVATSPPNSPLVTAQIDDADRITIEAQAAAGQPADAARVELRKVHGAWVVHSDYDMPVDKSRLDQLLSELKSLKRGLPIGTTNAALRRFKVGDRDFVRSVTLSENGKPLAKLLLGTSAGLRKTDARAGGEHAVYAVNLPVYELPTDAASWFNDALLQVPPAKMAQIDIRDARDGHLQLTRQIAPSKAPGPWQASGIDARKQVDEAQVAALARAIGELRVDKVLGTAAQPDWQLQAPLVDLTIQDTAGRQVTWTVSKSKSGDFDILKSSAHPWYFSLTAAQAKEFLDAGKPGALLSDAKPLVKSEKGPGALRAKTKTQGQSAGG